MVDSTSEMLVEASLITDDFPINGSYIRRAQCAAMGFPMPEVCDWSRGWPSQASALFMPVPLASRFADLADEFDLRGKLTVLPCPGGLGRMDRSVRGLPDADRLALLDLVRERFAPRFDISLEVLTHSMGFDLRTEGLLPHTETAWVSHLATPGPGHHEALCEYLRFGWQILANEGIHVRCAHPGGMPDPSNLVGNRILNRGHHIERLADAIRQMRLEFAPDTDVLLTFADPPRPQPANGRPNLIRRYDDRFAVYAIQDVIGESLLGVFHGVGDVNAEADRLVTPDLGGGTLIEAAEAGKVVSLLSHAQSLSSCNTGLGLDVLHLALSRLRERYGKRLVWRTPTELVRRGLVNN